MKYLFIDCEFATSKNNAEKICEFGYILVDDTFKIIEKDNILINPNILKNEWDWYALKKILTRKRKEYETRKHFDEYYPKISSLIKTADFIIGHSIPMDINALNCDIKRYGLAPLDFKYYDLVELYKSYSKNNTPISLERMLNELGVEGDPKHHDAGADAYNTMLALKAMIHNMNTALIDFLNK